MQLCAALVTSTSVPGSRFQAVVVDDHRAFGPADPGGEAGGPADAALHGVVTLVLLVVAVWPGGAHGPGGGVNSGASPVRAFSGRVPGPGPGHLRSADG
jgi:hypothetical protein